MGGTGCELQLTEENMGSEVERQILFVQKKRFELVKKRTCGP